MNRINKLISLIIVLIMVVCLAVPCYAVNTESTPNSTKHTITLNKEDPTEATPTVFAYQIFRGDITAGKLTNITWGSGVPQDRTSLVNALISAGILPNDFLTNVAEENIAQAVAEVVAEMENDSAELDAFAELIAQHLSDTYATNNGSDTFDVTGDGYYLLMNPTGGTNAPDAYTKYILKVTSEETVITMKKDAPSLTKEIVGGQEASATSASIGDKITFKLESTIPAMDGYDKYYYIIHDTLSSGLTFNDDIAVAMNGQNMVAYTEGQSYQNSDYYVEYSTADNTIQIVFINFLKHKGQTGSITVSYSATLNENAVIAPGSNDNTAYLEYSNDPNYDHDGDTSEEPSDDIPGDDIPTGTTPQEVVKVYTTALKLNKLSNDGKKLGRAKFKIEGSSTGIYMINGTVYQKNSNGTWYRLTNGAYTENPPSDNTASRYESTTDKYVQINVNKETVLMSDLVQEGWVRSNGAMNFTGLGAGTYTITELIAPAGYNLLKSPITVEIQWNGTEAADMWTVKVSSIGFDGKVASVVATLINNVYSFDVINQPGVELPSTGGMGTTLFYITGAMLLVTALVLLITKKRMASIL